MIFNDLMQHTAQAKTKYKEAFTLVEVVLYIGIVSVIIITIASFFGATQEVQKRNLAKSEVDQTAVQILELISQTIRNASSVSSPTPGNSASTLNLTVPVGENSPTLFSIAGSTVRIQEGLSAAVDLNSSRVTALALNFSNITGIGPNSVIKFQFTLAYVNPDNQSALNYQQTFYGSAILR